MKGDFSRLTGVNATREHYNSVMKQQGRVQLDSDWNELMAIISHQRRIRTIDIIGRCGVPVHDSGFEIRHPGGGLQDLLISSGRFYTGGLLCETYPVSKIPVAGFPANNKITIDDLRIDGVTLEQDQWIVIFSDETPEGIFCQITAITNLILTVSQNVSALSSDKNIFLRRMILFTDQVDNPDATWTPVAGQKVLVYLDTWERHITTIENPSIRETALSGPDTDTRIQTVSQVKIFPIAGNVGNVQCPDEIPGWKSEIATGTGRLKTHVDVAAQPANPCDLGESGGYNGLENYFYRVEIHTGGALGTATFKYSMNNGSTAYAIEEFIPDDSDATKVFKLKLQKVGKDEILKIKKHDWLEISGDNTDLDVNSPGTMAKVLDVKKLELTLDTDVAANENEAHPKIRRWNITPEWSTALQTTAAGPLKLEKGIQLNFSGGMYKTGDYWVFTARTAESEIEELDYELPRGIKHHYCKLALVTWQGDGTADIEDCRPEFPPLTELPKDSGKGCCTVTVGKDGEYDDIQQAVNALNGGPGTVCILPGIYEIETPIIVNGRDITIKGCESSSIILNLVKTTDSIVFYIQNSQGIDISNLWCVSAGEGGRAIVSETSNFINIKNCVVMATGLYDLAGAITFQGNSFNTEINDCLIAGMIAIRYQNLGKNDTAVHTSVRIEQNTVFALENAILQTKNAAIMGLIVLDNLLLGFNMGSISKAYFPQTFFTYVEKNTLYDMTTLKKAKSNRKYGNKFEKVSSSNVMPLFQLMSHLKSNANAAMLNRKNMTAIQFPTSEPLINLKQGAMDANILNNYIIGKIGIFSELLLESTIERNWILTSQVGIALGSFEGVTIDDNFIYSGESGIQCVRQLATNFTISNNRFISETNGIEFMEFKNGNRQPVANTQISQLVMNAQISQNSISAKNCGIKLCNPEILVYDFTAFDNSISNCDEFGIILDGLDENQFLGKDVANYQRVIQRNSIQVKNTGIEIGVSDAKILDNDITISYSPINQQNLSYGIKLHSENCFAVNNSVHGTYDPQKNIYSKGGIYINIPLSNSKNSRSKNIILKTNRLSGGIGNGIEIGNDIDDLVIENNFIYNMGLNGIAVDINVGKTNNLSISNNRIKQCNNLISTDNYWWKYAGIVLKSGEKIQILGNEICENGRTVANPDYHIGGIYGEQVKNIIIANNQFVDNGYPKSLTSQAIINIPANPGGGNESVKIVDNLVSGSLAPAIFLGGEWIWGEIPINLPRVMKIRKGLDKKTVITGNHFESPMNMVDVSTVEIQSSRCIFSNNYVECPDGDNLYAADLGFGWHATVLGNVTSAKIYIVGWRVEKYHNVIF